jgi:hypothetical protein
MTMINSLGIALSALEKSQHTTVRSPMKSFALIQERIHFASQVARYSGKTKSSSTFTTK